MKTVTERFLKYVSFDTMSDEFSETCPSSAKQKLLGAQLVKEMQDMGITDAFMDENGYVYGTVPGDPNLPTIGLIAHMDTSPDASGADIKARIVEYTGEDICLNEEKGIFLRESDYPSLKRHHGKHLIVTDGTTLLGADDKAGIAEIMATYSRNERSKSSKKVSSVLQKFGIFKCSTASEQISFFHATIHGIETPSSEPSIKVVI